MGVFLEKPKNADQLVGRQFGRLTVRKVYFKECPKRRVSFADCLCSCGKEHTVRVGGLTTGDIQSCGCWKREVDRKRHFIHGHTCRAEPGTEARVRSLEYGVWVGMVARCHNPRAAYWHCYGARGITVCSRWRKSFRQFLDDVGPRPSSTHTLDRIDNDKGYYKENCRWATPLEQNLNRRTTRWVQYRGRRVTLVELSHLSKVSFGTVDSRLRRGWSVEDAVEAPLKASRWGPAASPSTSGGICLDALASPR